MLLSENQSFNNDIILTTSEPAILATQLSKSVGNAPNKIHILRELHLQVSKGETIAIIGSSGSGKSTLLALLAGLDIPTSGDVTVNNQPFSALDENTRAAVRGKSMGFVFQSFQLVSTMTALENVMLPMQLANRSDAKTVAIDTLKQVGLGDRLSHYPRQLSGGEQQRVAIARAFSPQPAILFADEPTGNLDSATGAHIIDLLFHLNAAAGTTLVLVTHDAQLAKRCQRIYQLIDGKLQAAT
jgi:putative ABC transport system ATP-binding protein